MTEYHPDDSGPNWIINTPAHKRWWLPDWRHQFDSRIHGDILYWSVIDSRGYTKEKGQIDIKNPAYEDLHFVAQDLARKKYRSQRVRDNIPKVLQGKRREV